MTLPPAQFSTLYCLFFFLRYSSHVQLHKQACARAYVYVSGTFYVCLYLCVYGVGGMNPNEIFYGPVDLLIVPQVLSLLTPNLLETTCWAWFFSSVLSSSSSCFSSSFLPFLLLLKVTSGLISCSSLKLKNLLLKVLLQCTFCNQRMVAVSSF